MKHSKITSKRRSAAWSLAMAAGLFAQATQAKEYDLDAQNLTDALMAFSEKAGVEIIVPTRGMQDLTAQALKGDYSVEEGLAKLLDNSGLSYRKDGNNVFIVYRDITVPESDKADTEEENHDVEEEIVVTGSHIRGIDPVGAPALRFDREEIERAGYATMGEFFRSLPQNFTRERDFGEGYQRVDLRGLGSGTTLSLLNGRRLPDTAATGGADVGAIPVSMIERIEILTDGASALYGSDAVGGVINFVLRDDLDGAETQLSYSTTRAGGAQAKFSQAFGTHWDTGNIVAQYTYDDSKPISSQDRSEDFVDANTFFESHQLISGSEKHHVMVNLKQQAGDRIELYANTLFTKEKTRSQVFGSEGDRESDQLHTAIGAQLAINDQWQMDISAVHGEDKSDIPQKFQTRTFNVKLDGMLFAMPSEDNVRLAIGGERRRESMNLSSNRDNERTVVSGFGELYIPLVSETNRRPGVEALDISIAGRYDDYNDFGSKFVPKVGLAWAPLADLKLRATWGESFRAPTLLNMLNQGTLLIINTYHVNDPTPESPDNLSVMLRLLGTNDVLGPETSENLSVGIDFSPEQLPGLNLSVTYIDIDYQDKISPVPLGSSLSNEDFLAPFIVRRPSDPAGSAAFDAQVDAWLAMPTRFPARDYTGGAEVDVIVDSRITNVATTGHRGLDFSLGYSFDTELGLFGVTVGGSYIHEKYTQAITNGPSVQTYNSYGEIPDLRLRNSVSWSRDNISVNAGINYTDNYRDDRTPLLRPVRSNTTVDLSLAYEFVQSWLEGTRLLFNASNLFDRGAPRTEVLSFLQSNYDDSNSSAVGRRFTVSLTKTW